MDTRYYISLLRYVCYKLFAELKRNATSLKILMKTEMDLMDFTINTAEFLLFSIQSRNPTKCDSPSDNSLNLTC